MYKFQIYTIFVITSLVWACAVFLFGVRDEALTSQQQQQQQQQQLTKCDVISVLNKTVDALSLHNEMMRNRSQTMDVSAKTATTNSRVHLSALETVFHNFTLKEDLRNRIQYVLKTHIRPIDKSYNFNVTGSDRIPVDRGIRDTRPEQCQRMRYDVDAFPSTSVVIPFYNEALSTLLRTIHSILGRTPDVLLQEVILVDDASTYPYLQTSLQDYIALIPKVKLVRNEKREGLVRSRLIGAEMSQGEVLVFLDAHTEANTGEISVKWLLL